MLKLQHDENKPIGVASCTPEVSFRIASIALASHVIDFFSSFYQASVTDAVRVMKTFNVSCLVVVDGALLNILFFVVGLDHRLIILLV